MKNPQECPDCPGNREVVELLWTNYDLVLGYIDSSMPDSMRDFADADDILQETYTAAWQNFDSFSEKDSGSFSGWLKTIAKRKLIDRIRMFNSKKRGGVRVTRQIVSSDGRSMQADDCAARDRSPSSEVASIEARDMLNESLGKIPERHKRAIRLRYFDCRSLADVAKEMSLSVDATHMLLKRATVSLRNAMGSGSQFF